MNPTLQRKWHLNWGVQLSTALLLVLFASLVYPLNLFAQSAPDPRWRHYKQEDGLSSNDIWSILVVEDGIWFGGSDSVSFFNGTWSTYPSQYSALPYPLSSDDSAEKTGLTDRQSVTVTNRDSGANDSQPATILGEVSALAQSDFGLHSGAGVSNSTSENGLLWIGTRQGQIALLNVSSGQWHQVAQLEEEVTDLSPSRDVLWVATNQNLYRMPLYGEANSDFPVVTLAEPMDVEGPVYNLLSKQDTLYVGHEVGVKRLDGEDWVSVAIPSAEILGDPGSSWCTPHETQLESTQILSSDGAPVQYPSVHAMWFDAEGAFWIGTAEGAARRTVESATGNYCWIVFPTYTPEGKLALVQSLAGDGHGSIWAATDGGGALLFDEFGALTLPFGRTIPGNLNTDFVRDVAVDQDGSAWFATPVGVFQFLERTWYLEPGYAEPFGLSIGDANIHNIRDLLVDQGGRLWIATGAGIRVKESPTLERIRYDTEGSNLPSNNVLSLAEDSFGHMWAGTDGAGVARFADGQWSQPLAASQLPSTAVTELVADEEGTVWIGTDGGLLSYEIATGSSRWVNEVAGSTIHSLSFDSNQHLWIASSQQDETGKTSATIWQHTSQTQSSDLLAQDLLAITGASTLPYTFELNLAADYTTPGGIWLAVDQVGLFHWNGERWHNGDPTGQLPTDFLWTLHTEPNRSDLWIGNEGGVTRFDGRSWATLKDEDGLRSPATWAIASDADGGFWFGGKTGLSYYQPDTTPPWIGLGNVIGGNASLDSSIDNHPTILVSEGDSLSLALRYGDLQTPRDKIQIYYREIPLQIQDEAQSEIAQTPLTNIHVPWVALNGLYIPDTGTPLLSRIEFQARDQSFNYSEIYKLSLTVASTNVFDLSVLGLGKVERTTFFTLIALSLLAVLGFGYVSLEIVQGRRRTLEGIARSYNPYVSGQPIRRNDMFFGRHNLLQRIIDTLHNNSIMIHGERRIGKTTMLYQIANRLEDVSDPDYWFLPIYIDLEGTPQEHFFYLLIEEIVHRVLIFGDGELTEYLDFSGLLFYKTIDADYSDREFSRDLRRVVRQLQTYGQTYRAEQQLRMILLMDEMDVMTRYDHLIQQQLRRIFMRDFSSTMGAVVAGIEINRDWDRIESPWYNMFNEIKIEPFGREEAIELLVEPVKDYYSYEQEALDFIIEQSDGRPFRIQQYGLEVVTSMLAAGRRRITLEDVLVAHQNIQDSYTHTHSDAGLSQPGQFDQSTHQPSGQLNTDRQTTNKLATETMEIQFQK
ncbi:MAG: two-component regulator propeller domain-containing protein [Chloroflexota bacterium]